MRFRTLAFLALSSTTVLAAGGCVGLTDVFNEEFLQATSLGPRAASLPGDAPAILVTVDNRTGRVVQAQVSYRGNDAQVQSYTTTVTESNKSSQALPCPVTELTLGDVSDLDVPGAVIRLGLGNADDPFVEVEPFGVLLKEQANYECGDSITFAIVPSGASLSGFQVFAFIQRASNP